MRSATERIRAADPTDVPPNLRILMKNIERKSPQGTAQASRCEMMRLAGGHFKGLRAIASELVVPDMAERHYARLGTLNEVGHRTHPRRRPDRRAANFENSHEKY